MRHRRIASSVLVWAVLFTGASFADTPEKLDDLRRHAEQAMKAGQWDKARELYEQLFTRDRSRPDVRRQFLRAHRIANLTQRHRDPSYREHLAEYDLRAACLLYREVTTKLRANYLDADKTDFTHLFRYGLDELRLALDNDVFRHERLSTSVRPFDIQAFRNQLNETWGTRIIQSQRELETEVTRIAQAGRAAIELDPVVTVLEFACGACHGLDEHTLYLTPSQLSEVVTTVEGDLPGVGIDVERRDGAVTITRIASASPAANAALAVGDVITHIEGKPVVDLAAEEVTERLRGAAGTLVELQVSPKGESKSRTLALTRQPIRAPSLGSVHVFPEQPGIGYCRIVSFQKHTAQELDDALVQLQMQGMKVLILDLRGNWGGYFPSAIQVSERFLTEGKVIVTTESQVPEHVRVYKASYPGAVTIPLVVLVDQETASAAEVVAGALHAHRRATLVGQPTFGKWSVQRVLELKSARSGIRVTLARFLSPGSEPYTIKGVVPDVLEERSPISMADNQLLVAIQVAVGMIEMRP